MNITIELTSAGAELRAPDVIPMRLPWYDYPESFALFMRYLRPTHVQVTRLRLIPQYQHDCECCVFLGHYTDRDGTNFDLYFCSQGGWLGTLIARWSSNGPDYYNGLEFGRHGNIQSLKEAYKRALRRGLVQDVERVYDPFSS